LDGISEPLIKGFDTVIPPGPKPVDPGVIVTGHTGDKTPRADWAKDGSFLVFRYLFQQVPEFNDFLNKHPIRKDGNGKVLTPEQGSALLGARMVGRWKSGKSYCQWLSMSLNEIRSSGAPVDITPFEDDPDLAR
jgi:deferrochelatase/peroxidase EfeB